MSGTELLSVMDRILVARGRLGTTSGVFDYQPLPEVAREAIKVTILNMHEAVTGYYGGDGALTRGAYEVVGQYESVRVEFGARVLRTLGMPPPSRWMPETQLMRVPSLTPLCFGRSPWEYDAAVSWVLTDGGGRRVLTFDVGAYANCLRESDQAAHVESVLATHSLVTSEVALIGDRLTIPRELHRKAGPLALGFRGDVFFPPQEQDDGRVSFRMRTEDSGLDLLGRRGRTIEVGECPPAFDLEIV